MFSSTSPDAVSGAEEDVNISVSEANHDLVQLGVPVATNNTLQEEKRDMRRYMTHKEKEEETGMAKERI